MAYSEKVVDHYENPRNVGSFAKDEGAVTMTADQIKAVIEQGEEIPYQVATSSGATAQLNSKRAPSAST